MGAGREHSLGAGRTQLDDHAGGFTAVLLRRDRAADPVNRVRLWLAGTPEPQIGRWQIVGRKLNGARVVEIDVDQPIRRLAQEHADVLRMAVEVLRRFAFAKPKLLPSLDARILGLMGNWDDGPSTTRVVRG